MHEKRQYETYKKIVADYIRQTNRIKDLIKSNIEELEREIEKIRETLAELRRPSF